MTSGKPLRALLVLLLLPALLGGCWDADSIEELDYVKAMGIDYEDGQFIVYLQLPNLASVAKKESPGPEVPAKAWVGIGKGDSINQAVGIILRSAPKKIIWGHTTTIVFGENMLKRKELPDVLEDLNRFRELRYTMWIYGTHSSIPDLFSVSPTFESSRMYTIMQNPSDNFKMNSYVAPIRLHDFMNDYQDPGQWAIIPSLDIDLDNWIAGEKPHAMHIVEGVHAFHMGKYTGFTPINRIQGLRWLKHDTVKASLSLEEGGEVLAILSIKDPDFDIRMHHDANKATFDIAVKLAATLIELHEPRTADQLIEESEKLVSEQIRSTYLAGLKQGTDLLGLSEYLYRSQPKLYNAWTHNGEKLFLTPESLGSIDVDIDLEFLGKYKFVH